MQNMKIIFYILMILCNIKEKYIMYYQYSYDHKVLSLMVFSLRERCHTKWINENIESNIYLPIINL